MPRHANQTSFKTGDPRLIGKKFSEERRKKISLALTGRIRPPFSKTWIDNMGKSRKGKKFTEEHRKKISESLKGKVKTAEHLKKISLAQKGKKRKPLTEEQKKKIARFGKNHWAWKGGDGSRGYDRRKREAQAGRPRPDACEACGMPTKDLKQALSYDHNHKTGEFRGWICSRCNLALGMVKDKIQVLIALIEYLRKTKTD